MATNKEMDCEAWIYGHDSIIWGLTPKGPFVPSKNNLGPSRFLLSLFIMNFFEIFWGCIVLRELHKYIILFQSDAGWKNYGPIGQHPKITKSQNNVFEFSFPKVLCFFFVYKWSFASFYLDLVWESYGQS